MQKKIGILLKSIILISSFLFFLKSISAQEIYTFDSMMKKLENHSEIRSLKSKSKSLEELSVFKSSWEDPVLRIDAINFPLNSLTFGKTPMTGIALTVSQQIPLTGKYGNMKDAFKEKSMIMNQQKASKLRELKKNIWLNLISLYRTGTEQSILNENVAWLDQIIKVTSKKYSTGKTTQEALLDLQVRKSEIESKVLKKAIEIEGLWKSLALALDEPGKNISLDHSSIPWNWLSKVSISLQKLEALPREKMLFHSKKSYEYELKAARKERVPDITVGL